MSKQNRRDGYMRKTKRKNVLREFVVFDTETQVIDNGIGNISFPFRLGVAKHILLDDNLDVKKSELFIFKKPNEFISWIISLLKKKKPMHIFAHNIGFDIRVLDLHNRFHNAGFESEPPIINNLLFLWFLKKTEYSIKMVDTSNFGVRSVDSLGKSLGFAKMSVDFDNVSDEELIEYCIRDVEILEIFLINYSKFLKHNDLGAFKLSLASQALTTYRYRFMYTRPFTHTQDNILELERKSYYGGRTECHKLGEFTDEQFYYLDVNSMYPYVMNTFELPYEYVGSSKSNSIEFLKARLHNYYVIAEVDLDTDENAYPYRYGNKLVFPIGSFRTVLHDVELRHAISKGHVKKIHLSAMYKRDYIFKEYVEFFYRLKKQYSNEGNESWRLITKLFLNSLYGKFGQLEPHRELLLEENNNDIWRLPCINGETGLSYQEICWYGKIYREYKQGETSQSNPAIAGSVTSLARYHLYNLYEIAGKQNVYYMDTDSLITNIEGANRLKRFMSDDRLGMLKIEEQSENLSIYGNKDYIFGETVRHKGVPSSAKKIDTDKWEYLQFQGFITWLNNGAVSGAIGHIAEKRRLHNYTKGFVLSNGDIMPLEFDNDILINQD